MSIKWNDTNDIKVKEGVEIIAPNGRVGEVVELIKDNDAGFIVIQFPDKNTICVEAHRCKISKTKSETQPPAPVAPPSIEEEEEEETEEEEEKPTTKVRSRRATAASKAKKD
ncbi:MAG: hypothetical protein ACXABY_04400 [Candidatus Thorarchaeota archaeon]|jgi:hypothetical protein